ncbi:hypothetical protein CR152_26960 [Massilia violaceinigra]|uniref:NACHT domain-containing protein n=1 Tax=Massilia violaceinigra TaxID=2045208 RepID=A0A2D2DRY1_9BURK|nr:hypothetical protein [Massilia violaceinigra]ATQ77736.1 hypothetical protein CR152_26960 [Massilia violaceinigra]
MGKSTLLEWLATDRLYALCTARKLINRSDPHSLLGNATVLVVDSLDEVNAQRDGDAVDHVLRKLGELDYPLFVLACRVADWRSATGREAIYEQYEQEPYELHLDPLREADAFALLQQNVGMEHARSIVKHLNERGLQGFLGNPQTLNLVSEIAKNGRLPDTKGELFEQAVNVLREETRASKSSKQPAKKDILDAAGAAFASMILTGSEAISRVSGSFSSETTISITEICKLPGGEFLAQALDKRLFNGAGIDRFTYAHRSIGEFLGARWLSSRKRPAPPPMNS